VYIPVASLPLMQQVGKEDASNAAGGKRSSKRRCL
jgi:hypothetical protein